MRSSIERTGALSIDELKNSRLFPSVERFRKGPVAIVECVQEIPCNPCEEACKFNAISIGDSITNIPRVDEASCTGCGVCISKCPGLAIFVVDKTYSTDLAAVSFPHEYLPLPAIGSTVEAVNREGEVVCSARVIKVLCPKAFNHTTVITVAVPMDKADEVRGIRRLRRGEIG